MLHSSHERNERNLKMILPLWAIFGLCAAALSALMMLLQEKLKVDSYALAFWNKVTCMLVMVPFLLNHGFPQDIVFYILIGVTAFIFATNDVVFFKGISTVGAGVVSRLLPASVIFSFLLWFAIDPSSVEKYAAAPKVTAIIFLVLCLWAFFAGHLKNCPVTMKALKTIWFLLFAAVVGPLLAKKATDHADIVQGPYAYIFVQSLMMITLWAVFFAVKKPVASAVLFSWRTLRAGLIFGCISSSMVLMNLFALYHVDVPAYSSAVGFLDSIIVLVAYALMGRKNDGNVLAAIGMVGCAAALIILKAQV